MTENISAAAATARETSRSTDGKFGIQALTEADFDLTGDMLPVPEPSQVVDGHQFTQDGRTTYATHTEVDGQGWDHQLTVTEDKGEWLKFYRPSSILLRNGMLMDQDSRSVPTRVRRQIATDLRAVDAHHGIEEFNNAPEAPKTKDELVVEYVQGLRAAGADDKQVGLMAANLVVQDQLACGQKLFQNARQAQGAGDNGYAHGVLEVISVHQKASNDLIAAPSADYEQILTDAAAKARKGGMMAIMDSRGSDAVADALTQLAEAAGAMRRAGVPSVCVSEELAKADTDQHDVAADERG